MIPLAGRTDASGDHRRTRTDPRRQPGPPGRTDTSRRTGPSRRAAAGLGAALAVLVLTLGLASCGTAQGQPGAASSAGVTAGADARDGARAVQRQADAQLTAVTEAARADAAASAERASAQQAAARPGGAAAAGEPAQCTTRPEDRAACTMPEGAEITPGGGDLDGDGLFEPHEPVGPGYKDPRAYDGGPTSGEKQCAWAREKGHGC